MLFQSIKVLFKTWHRVPVGFFENDADLRYQDEIHGSILEQIDKIIEILHLKFMKAKISYEGIQRVDSDAIVAAINSLNGLLNTANKFTSTMGSPPTGASSPTAFSTRTPQTSPCSGT